MFAFGPIPAALPSSGSAAPDECLGPQRAFHAALLRAGTLAASAAMLAGFAGQLRGAGTADGVPTAPAPIVEEIYYQRPVIQPPIWTVWHQIPWNDEIGSVSVNVPPYGPAGAGTFIVQLEDGAIVTLEFATDIKKTWTGKEWRESLLSQPRQSYKATAYLTTEIRDVRSQLVAGAATGAPFLLGLAYEDATVIAPSSGALANVANTALLDWAIPGQRVIVIGVDGSTLQATVQAVPSASQLRLGDASTGAPIALTGALGAPGARILPLVPVYIDPQQGFARYPVTVEEWQLAARAAVFGYVGSDAMGVGAILNQFIDPTWGGVPVWDRGLDATSPLTDSVQSLADLVDMGGVPGNLGSSPAVDYGRQLALVSDDPNDWQWLKFFLFTIRGRQARFLVPTMRPDLELASNPGSALLVVRNGVGFGDPSQFFSHSTAQSRLWITKTDGTVQMVAVTGYADNFDGTGTLTLSATVTGTVAMLSFLETCRFESDSLSITWSGASFSFSATARVVQQ